MSGPGTSEGSYLTPRLENALVADAMRHGILSCSADAFLRDAARTMSLRHVHTILVTDEDGSPYGILSDNILLGALLDSNGGERALREVADRDISTISSSEPLLAAAELMRDRGVAHLLVRDAQSGRPTGMLSTLDVAGILAWGET
ncbi:MAG TPA: CBS domain-containing protein [Solirubrobacteraceae bacterium]|jgi:CBS domain-containing protein